jgi:hypothetical protein
LSGQQFAALTGIKYQTFATWAQKRRRQRGAYAQVKVSAQATDKVRWLEAVVEAAQTSDGQSAASLVVQLPGGARLEMTTAKQAGLVVELLRALRQPLC